MKLEVVDLAIGYEKPLIEGMGFGIEGPSLLQILGPNGVGKTTLLKTIIGLLKPLRGCVLVDGKDIHKHREIVSKLFGYVPQIFGYTASSYPITAWECVESALLLYRYSWPRVSLPKYGRDRVREVLELVELPRDKWFVNIWKLSGGERQRVLIARALVHDPPILVMDEPLASVDPVGKAKLAELIGRLSREKLVIVTSHDPTLLLPHTEKVLLLGRSMYIYGDPDEVLTLHNLRKVYGEAAIAVEKHVHLADHHIP